MAIHQAAHRSGPHSVIDSLYRVHSPASHATDARAGRRPEVYALRNILRAACALYLSERHWWPGWPVCRRASGLSTSFHHRTILTGSGLSWLSVLIGHGLLARDRRAGPALSCRSGCGPRCLVDSIRYIGLLAGWLVTHSLPLVRLTCRLCLAVCRQL